MSQGWWRWLASARLGLVLLVLLALAVVAGGTLPQLGRLSPAELNSWQTSWPLLAQALQWLGLSGVYGSWWFAALCLLLVANMAAAMLAHGLRVLAWLQGAVEPSHRIKSEGAASSALVRQIDAQQGSLFHHAGLLGVPLLHLGAIVLIAGAVLNASGRFAAHLELSEGEIFAGQPDKLIVESEGDRSNHAPAFRLRLDRLQVAIGEGKHLAELQAKLTVRDRGVIYHAEVEVNHPHAVGPYSVYLDKTLGQTAVFDRLLPDGRKFRLLINFPVSISAWETATPLQRGEMVELDGVPIFYRMALTPEQHPEFQLEAQQRGKITFNGRLAPGQMADLGAYRLVFLGTVPWAGLYLSADPYLGLVFAGMAMVLGGVLLHLLFRPRRLRLEQGEDGWVLQAWVMRDDWRFERQWREWEGLR